VLVVASAMALLLGFVAERRLAPIPLVAGLFALVFGGLALFFHDPRLLKIKPTVLNLAYALFMFGGARFGKDPLKAILGDAYHMSQAASRTLTMRFGVYFLFVAGLNEVVWRTQSDAVWVWFKFPGLVVFLLLFSLTQTPFLMKHLHDPENKPTEETPQA
jgi:intracellular septation protein